MFKKLILPSKKSLQQFPQCFTASIVHILTSTSCCLIFAKSSACNIGKSGRAAISQLSIAILPNLPRKLQAFWNKRSKFGENGHFLPIKYNSGQKYFFYLFKEQLPMVFLNGCLHIFNSKSMILIICLRRNTA